MPLHEYECSAGHKFERLHKTYAKADAEPKETPCDVCHEAVATRQTSIPTFRLLGDGFYKPSAVQGPLVGAADPTKLLPEFSKNIHDSMTGQRVGRKYMGKKVVESKRSDLNKITR